MASVALSIVGSAIGGPVGGYIGAAIGGYIDQNYLFAPDPMQGPRLKDLRVQSATLGSGKSMGKGTYRNAGLMIWATPYVEHGSTSGGKGGGGGGSATTYTYTQSMAIALGDEPIIGVRRIWANGRVIYDVGSDDPATIIASNAAGRLANGENFTVYRGTETQMPNSRIVAEQAKLQNAYYFIPAQMPLPEMKVWVGAGQIIVAGSPVRSLNQAVVITAAPGSNARIDRVVINKTTCVASVVVGTVSASPVPPAIPLGNYPCCQVYVAAGTLGILTSMITDERVVTWQPNTAYILGQYVSNSGNLYQCASAGVSGTSNLAAVGATVVGSIAPDADDFALGVLTVTSVTNGSIPMPSFIVTDSEGGGYWTTQPISGVNVTPGTNIVAGSGSGTGGTGTYPVDLSQTAASASIQVGRVDGTVQWAYLEAFNTIPTVPTPGYRGTPYVVFLDHSLSATGNTTPNFEFEVVEGTSDLGDYVTWAIGKTGLAPGDIDVTRLVGTPVIGLLTSDRSTVRSILQPLASAFFFDAVESDGKIKFVMRGGGLAQSIPETDLAAHANGSQMPDPLGTTRTQELDLPRVVTVQYPNSNFGFQPSSKYARQQSTSSKLETTLQIPISMTDSQGQAIADKMLNIAWNERSGFTFATGREYCYLEPTDIVSVSKGAASYEIRLTNKEEAAPGIFTWQAVAEDIGIYHNVINNLLDNVKPAAAWNTPPGSVSPPFIIDAPGIVTVTGFELWIAAGSANKNWGGCGVFVSTDGIVYTQIGTMRGSCAYGMGTVLSGSDPDSVNTLSTDLRRSGASMTSVSKADADNLLSLCFMGGELVSFETAALTTNGYDLTYLRRGVYGTTVAAHTGAAFIQLDTRVFKYPYDSSLIGQTLYFKFPSFNVFGGAGEDIGSLPAYSYTISGSISMPPNVTGFSCLQSGTIVAFKWNDLPGKTLLVYDIGYAPQGTTDRMLFTVVSERAKGTEMTNASIPPGTWTFGIWARDHGNGYSPMVTTFDLVVTNPNLNIIHDVEEIGWNGTLVGLVEHYTGVLVPDSIHNANYYDVIASPSTPGLSAVAGSLTLPTTFFVKITYLSALGETLGSAESSQLVGVTQALKVTSPGAVATAAGWNVYVSTATGTEILQNSTPLAIGADWTMPGTGLIAGAALPVTNTTGWEVFDTWVPDPVAYIEYTSLILDATYIEALRAFQTTATALGYAQSGTPVLLTQISYGDTAPLPVAAPNGSGGFINWVIGTAAFRYLQGRISANIAPGGLFAITDYMLNVDLSPITEQSGVINVAHGGTVVVFNPPFHSAPLVVPVAISSGLTSASVTAISATQCTLNVWNGATDAGLGTSATQAQFSATGE